ncbi:MAG TPA: ABC transporter ATP-binding protein [Gammaproteobacteria bacterium]|nr:ABC transporter ATP-binding protein [Gammaproteobacteria bacterium]
MRDAVIETRALRKRFGRNLAVADLSLSIGRGEVFGFLGPNGAGKTTSLKLLLGLVAPSAGSGFVLGAPLGDRAARARIGFLPEHFRFHDCLTGRELLRVHGRLYGLRGRGLEARIDELLERVRLTEAADRALHTYSKGMLQRAGLAQALVNSPELVFLDEPTSGLDPLGRVLVRTIIEELRAQGTSVFLNSHLLGEVEATCDRVVFVKRGRVVHELSLAESQGGAPAALDVELRIERAEPAILEGLAAFAHDVRRERDIVRLRVESERVLPELARWLVAAGVDLYELRSRRKSLEEWFLEVMGADQAPG